MKIQKQCFVAEVEKYFGIKSGLQWTEYYFSNAYRAQGNKGKRFTESRDFSKVHHKTALRLFMRLFETLLR